MYSISYKEVTARFPKLLRNDLDFLYNTTPRDFSQDCLICQNDFCAVVKKKTDETITIFFFESVSENSLWPRTQQQVYLWISIKKTPPMNKKLYKDSSRNLQQKYYPNLSRPSAAGTIQPESCFTPSIIVWDTFSIAFTKRGMLTQIIRVAPGYFLRSDIQHPGRWFRFIWPGDTFWNLGLHLTPMLAFRKYKSFPELLLSSVFCDFTITNRQFVCDFRLQDKFIK